MRLFNDSITEDSLAAILDGEIMDTDEDVQLVDYNFPDAVYTRFKSLPYSLSLLCKP